MKSNPINKDKYFLITVDVEDWFQVENFKPWIPFSSWHERELRVERNVHRLMDLFDSFESAGKPEARSRKANKKTRSINPTNTTNSINAKSEAAIIQLPNLSASQPRAEGRPKATFFVLGWIAEQLPHLIREIQARGHEVASHGINHLLSNKLAINDLKIELNDSKKLIEDIIGSSVFGFRAPSFSINENVLKATEEAGYLYGSSYNSFNMHERYGQIDLSANGKKGIAYTISDNFYELPLSNLELMRKIIPWSGGAYFRLIPYRLFRRGIQSILKKNRAYVFYMHPWEVDPGQPKVEKASIGSKFRQYTNLGKTHSRLRNLIASFSSCNFVTCKEYLTSGSG